LNLQQNVEKIIEEEEELSMEISHRDSHILKESGF